MSVVGPRAIDMQSKKYFGVTAVRHTGKCSSGDFKWKFLCDCGKSFEANGYSVRSGKVTSCQDCAKERVRLASVKHGKTETPEFEIWMGMHTRCYNAKRKEFKNYGGRGIVICNRWRESFENFLADMGHRPSPNHSIERYDNDGNYEPGNCKWATDTEQSNNRRTNVNVTINGVTKTASQWANEYGVQATTVLLRHRQGHRGEALFKSTVAQVTFSGITDTIHGWSKRTGIKPSTIAMRINHYNWPVSKALTKGVLL